MSTMQRNIMIICAVVMLGVFAVIHLLLVQPRLELAQQKASLNADVAAKTKRLDKVNELKAALPTLDAKVSDLSKVGLPKDQQLPDLLEQVEQAVLSQGDFKLVSFDPILGKATVSTDQAAGGLTETAFSITVRGDAKKLSSVFDVLNNNLRPMYVKGIVIAPNADDGAPAGSVNATISMVTFNTGSAAVAAVPAVSSTTTP